MHRNGETARGGIAQAELLGGGPPGGQRGVAVRRQGIPRNHEPAQREERMELRCVAAKLFAVETGPPARGGVDGVVLVGRKGVLGQASAQARPVGRVGPVPRCQLCVHLAPGHGVQPHGRQSLPALLGEGVVATPVLGRGQRAQHTDHLVQTGHPGSVHLQQR